jgi:ABC-type glycerol-3-phosphate transport system substrate-binding protein
VQVKLITLPVGDYAQRVQAAAAHGGLPDLLCARYLTALPKSGAARLGGRLLASR